MDTSKGRDRLCPERRPGSDEVTIDFNYAYNPSCAYDPHWACPLAPRENWLPVGVEAGEMTYESSEAAEPGPSEEVVDVGQVEAGHRSSQDDQGKAERGPHPGGRHPELSVT